MVDSDDVSLSSYRWYGNSFYFPFSPTCAVLETYTFITIIIILNEFIHFVQNPNTAPLMHV